MTLIFRAMLFLASLFSIVFFIKRIRKSKIQIDDSLFWVLVAFAGIVLSFFPKILIRASEIIGVQSPANLLYLALLFVLIIRDFRLTVKLSQIEMKLNKLGQDYAIEKMNEKSNGK